MRTLQLSDHLILHCTPLECGECAHHGSIDIALRWSVGITFVFIYRHWGFYGSSIAFVIHSLDHSRFVRLIPAGVQDVEDLYRGH